MPEDAIPLNRLQNGGGAGASSSTVSIAMPPPAKPLSVAFALGQDDTSASNVNDDRRGLLNGRRRLTDISEVDIDDDAVSDQWLTSPVLGAQKPSRARPTATKRQVCCYVCTTVLIFTAALTGGIMYYLRPRWRTHHGV